MLGFKNKLAAVFLSAAVGLTGSAAAEAGTAPLDQDLFAACSTKSGLDVIYTPSERRNSSLHNFSAVIRDETGAEGTRHKVARIFYDQAALANMPAVSQLFLMRHECAHHELGHTETYYRNPRVSRALVARFEQEADCSAAQSLQQEGISRDEIAQALEIFRDERATSTHLAGPARIAYTLSCLSPPNSALIFR